MARPPRPSDPARKRTKRGTGSAREAGTPRKAGTPREAGTPRKGRRRRQQPLEHRLLLTAILCLLAGGAVMVYSASSARTLLEGQGDGTLYLTKYVIYGAIGLVAMHLISRHGLVAARRYTPMLLLIAFVMLVLVHVPGLGIKVNGARRWLGAGPLTFQPSEVMKLALILHTSAMLAGARAATRSGRHGTTINLLAIRGPVLGVTAAAVVLVAAQPDLGTALVTSFTIGALLVAAGLPLRQLGLLAGAGAVLVLLFALLDPYRVARLTAFINPWADAGNTGFQAVQGQIAIGSGGFMGLGLGESVQKIFYLPEAHTDFILAVIGEELGVAGICGLLGLYGMIGYAGLRTARNATGDYAKLLAAGLTSLILCQALLNIYTVLGLAPLTGVPLPFISSGSTSLIVLLCSMGLLLNIASGGSRQLRAVPSRNAGSGKRAAREGGRPSARTSAPEPTRDAGQRAAAAAKRAAAAERSERSERGRSSDRDRGGRDGRPRRTGDRHRRRAAG